MRRRLRMRLGKGLGYNEMGEGTFSFLMEENQLCLSVDWYMKTLA